MPYAADVAVSVVAESGRAQRWLGPGPFVVAATAAGVVLLVLGSGMTFFADEWAFIESRSLSDPIDWLRPHNEHWSTLPIIVYRLMVETIGIGSYMPYLAVVVALHVGVACLVYRLVERRSGRPTAFVAGMLVALFGAGFENLYWGFQTGFVASVLFGLAAVDVTDHGPTRGRRARRRQPAPALAALVRARADHVRAYRHLLAARHLVEATVLWLGIPAATYVAWYLAFGRYATFTGRSPWSLEALSSAPSFVVRGMGNAGGAITGLEPRWGSASRRSSWAWVIVRAIRGTVPPARCRPPCAPSPSSTR